MRALLVTSVLSVAVAASPVGAQSPAQGAVSVTARPAAARLDAEILSVMNQPPAVIVNGEGLTRAEFEHLVEAGRRMPTSATSAAVDPDAVVDVVNEVLAAQDAAVRGYRLTDAQFDSAVRNIRERNRISTDDQFEAALTQQGLTRSGFRRSLERQLQFSRLRFQVEGGASIRDQDRVWDDYLRSLRSRAEVEWSDSQMEEAYKVGVARRQQ